MPRLVCFSLFFLYRAKDVYVCISVSIIVWIFLLALFAWKQIAGKELLFDWPLLTFFVLFCVIVAQAAAITSFIAFAMIRQLLAE